LNALQQGGRKGREWRWRDFWLHGAIVAQFIKTEARLLKLRQFAASFDLADADSSSSCGLRRIRPMFEG
jgi:hypothetical protein